MTLDATARTTAERLIRAFGKAVTIRRVTRSFDPASGKAVETTQDFPAKVSPPERFREDLVGGTLVRAGDLRAQLAAEGLTFIPEPVRDRIVIDGTAWELLRVDPVMSGEQTALYTLHLHRQERARELGATVDKLAAAVRRPGTSGGPPGDPAP